MQNNVLVESCPVHGDQATNSYIEPTGEDAIVSGAKRDYQDNQRGSEPYKCGCGEKLRARIALNQ